MWHAGKTTLLRNLLSQNKYKIGCIVNDVAAVNIDAKLIRNRTGEDGKTSTSDLAPTIELQNGCACMASRLLAFLVHEAAF
jgi:G3E family GTPase